jgi:non-ribosomal peptide synthetase component F
LIHRYANQEDIACSIINSGREHLSMHGITGFFVNAVIFRCHADPDQSFVDFVREVNKEAMELFRNQHYPVELVLEKLKLKYPVLPGSFNMLNMQDTSLNEELENTEPYYIHDFSHVKFDFECYLMEYRNGYDLRWVYKRNVYKPQTMKHIIGQYIKILDYFTRHPQHNFKQFRQTGKKKKSIW